MSGVYLNIFCFNLSFIFKPRDEVNSPPQTFQFPFFQVVWTGQGERLENCHPHPDEEEEDAEEVSGVPFLGWFI